MEGRKNELEIQRPEEMLREVEGQILKELREIERTVNDRRSADTASCQAAYLGRLMRRRNLLLQRCEAERRRA